MKKSLLYVAYLLIVFSFSLHFATQITAKNLGMEDKKIYPPNLLFIWLFDEVQEFDVHNKGEEFDGGIFILLGGILLGIFPALFIFRKNKQKNDYIHGDSSFMNLSELKKSGLYNRPNGVVLCQEPKARIKIINKHGRISLKIQKKGNLLVDDSNTHTLVTAPTRSGKGIGCIIPTLCFWQGSVLVYDIKRENWGLTSGLRSLFSTVLKVDFLSEGSVKWNPLLEIRIDTLYEISDCQNFAEKFMNPQGDKPRDIWLSSSIKLMTALLIYMINSDEKEKSIRAIYQILAPASSGEDENEGFAILDSLQKILDFDTKKDAVNIVMKKFVAETMNTAESEKQFIGIISSTLESLGLYLNPIVAENTSASDFYIDDIMNSEKPVSLYYCVSPGDMTLLNPLTRLFFSIFIMKNIDDINRKYKHRCLMLIDEFPSMGKMEKIEEGLSYVAGYGIKLLLIIQDLNQLYSIYGDKTPILGNSNIQMYYTPTDDTTAERLSKRLGTTTIITKSTSSSGQRTELFNKGISTSTSQSAKALMTSRQIQEMPYDRALIFVAGQKPIYAKKNAFYADSRFLWMTKLPPQNLLVLEGLKSHKQPEEPEPEPELIEPSTQPELTEPSYDESSVLQEFLQKIEEEDE